MTEPTHHLLNNLMLTVAALLLSLNMFLDTWLWSPMFMIYFFIAVMTFDFVTGVAVSFRRGEKWSTSRGFNWCVKIVVLVLLLGICHNLSKIVLAVGLFFPTDTGVETFVSYIPKVVYLRLIFDELASGVKNASILGIIKGDLSEWIIRNIDKQKPRLEEPSQTKSLKEQTQNK